MKRIIFAGTIKKNPNCGESIKNDLFIRRFSEVYEKIYTIELSQIKKHPWNLLKLIWLATIHPRAPIIISLRSHVADFVINVMSNLRISNNIYFWVVGGSFHINVEKGVYNQVKYTKIKKLIVQSPVMVKSLKRSGVDNVVCIPNSKRIDYLPDISYRNYDIIRFVFLSRIHPDKGCNMIINCVRRLNEMGLSDKYEVDFWGAMFYDNPDLFYNQIRELNNIHYKGFLNLSDKKGYDILSEYSMMLFPTWWSGEGFPGVIIDAYIAGLPVIASNWNFNTEVVTPDLGIIIPMKNEEALFKSMKEIIEGKVNLKEMSLRCQSRAKTYDNRIVLSEECLNKLELL